MRIGAKPECRARRRKLDGPMIGARAATRLFALHFFVLCGIAAAQTPSPEAPPPNTSNTPAPPSSESQGGFFDAFGNWMQQGVANVGAGFGAMVGAVGGQAGQAAKGAADAASTVAKGAPTSPATPQRASPSCRSPALRTVASAASSPPTAPRIAASPPKRCAGPRATAAGRVSISRPSREVPAALSGVHATRRKAFAPWNISSLSALCQ